MKKHVVLMILLSINFYSYKIPGHNSVPTDPGSKLSGDYKIKRIITYVDEKTKDEAKLPKKDISAILAVRRKEKNSVTISIMQYKGKTLLVSHTIGNFFIKTATVGYDLYLDNIKAGTINNKQLIITLSRGYSKTDFRTGIATRVTYESEK